MNRGAASLLVIACVVAVGQSVAVAATYPVDDRASSPYESTTRLQWDSIAPQRGKAPTVSGKMFVQVHLDVRSWRQRIGRVYLRLQPTTFGTVNATWSTNGRLLGGNVRSGERTLVYSGPIQTDTLDDLLTLTLQADGRRLLRTEPLNFTFEIDVN